jgi:ABC-type nitrate/sulfonate/bicarbonate transport system ATPase subunit
VAEQVRLRHVSKQFGERGAPLGVLRDVSIEIPAGSVLAVLGPSGCGKSTLLRLIAGLEHPSGGSVSLEGRAVAEADPHCAVVFQEPRLFPWLTVTHNVAFGARRLPSLPSVEQLLDLVGLTGFGKAYPHQLSGGMAQRVALARALIGRPEVLLLDEPFAALDALTRIQMQDLVAEVHAELRPTVVLVTHDIDEALVLADRVVVLGGRPATIQATLELPYARPRDRGSAELATLRAQILARLGFGSGAHSLSA